ncbi:MAG: hypothetical protein IT379_41645, partial [Deltaproteobacteria bacterium]|nr:hypothetical protein [Deltaproteobacteria bacterium]
MIGRTHLAALAMLTATACGDDDTSGAPDVGPTDASGGETGLDAGPRDAEPPDVAPPPPPIDAGPPRCLDVVARDLDVDLDADGRDGQIHAALAFEADTVWVVYSEPEAGDTGLFDVRARRFACDGSPSGASFAVQSTSDGNDVDPEIALGEGGALVAWTKDDGSGGTANLQIHARAFDLDGEPRSVEQRISTTRDGMPVPDNHLDARVVPLDDGFLLAGARALPDVMRFQAFVQALDGAGAARGDARDVLVEMQTSQGAPAIAARGAMDGWIAYERTEDGAADG